MHPIPGLVGMGENLMFLSKGKLEVIGVKFFYKPDIEVIDFVAIGNDIAILTSYFTVELYSLAQDSSCNPCPYHRLLPDNIASGEGS